MDYHKILIDAEDLLLEIAGDNENLLPFNVSLDITGNVHYSVLDYNGQEIQCQIYSEELECYIKRGKKRN